MSRDFKALERIFSLKSPYSPFFLGHPVRYHNMKHMCAFKNVSNHPLLIYIYIYLYISIYYNIYSFAATLLWSKHVDEFTTFCKENTIIPFWNIIKTVWLHISIFLLSAVHTHQSSGKFEVYQTSLHCPYVDDSTIDWLV